MKESQIWKKKKLRKKNKKKKNKLKYNNNKNKNKKFLDLSSSRKTSNIISSYDLWPNLYSEFWIFLSIIANYKFMPSNLKDIQIKYINSVYYRYKF